MGIEAACIYHRKVHQTICQTTLMVDYISLSTLRFNVQVEAPGAMHI